MKFLIESGGWFLKTSGVWTGEPARAHDYGTRQAAEAALAVAKRHMKRAAAKVAHVTELPEV
jgi:hypothetical protein